MGKLGSTNRELKRDLYCRERGSSWRYDGQKTTTKCPYCGKQKDTRIRPDARFDSGRKIPYAIEKKRESSRRGWMLRRKRAFFEISGSHIPKCVRCGCNDIRLLEINHKFGGGQKDRKNTKGTWYFHMDIINKKVDVSQYEILCRPCNAIHYLEMKYGNLPIKVVWNG